MAPGHVDGLDRLGALPASHFAATSLSFPGRKRTRSDTPRRPRVHTRHATVRSAFTHARTSPAKADSVASVRTPAACHPPRSSPRDDDRDWHLRLRAFVAGGHVDRDDPPRIPPRRRVRVAQARGQARAARPPRSSHAISAPTEGLGPTGVTTAGPVPSLRELRQSIPKECFEPDLAESMKYAAYDLAALAACFGALSPVVVDHPWLLPLYAPLTGTVMWMNFVIGHDCG